MSITAADMVPRRSPVNHSLRAADPPTHLEVARPSRQTVSGPAFDALAGLSARQRSRLWAAGGVSARRDRVEPLGFLAARYPVTRRLTGELSFRVVARRFIGHEPPAAPIPDDYGDDFPRFLRGLGDAAS